MAIDLFQMFEKFEDEFLKFDRVTYKLSSRPDLHAFILLNTIQPSEDEMIADAAEDHIWLDIDCRELAKVITEAQIIELARCGVFYDKDDGRLSMIA